MTTKHEGVLQQALKRFDEASEAYHTQRLEARDDLRFVAGDQWTSPASDDELRIKVNLLKPFLRQITAEARSANPAIRVIPVGDGADQDKAEVYSGLIRHLEQKCDAEAVYQQALWYAAAAGEGYLFIDSEYCDTTSFNQDLIIKGCNNPEKVFLDPHHELLDGCDSEWGFIIEDMDHDAYCRQFEKSDLADAIGNGSWSRLSLPGDWLNKDTVRVAKYYTKEYKMKTIYQVLDAATQKTVVQDKPATEVQVPITSRQVQEVTVMSYWLNAYEVLEEAPWPGKYIPIVKVTGETFYVGGAKYQAGAIRDAKDPQRQYNYFTSRQTEMVDLAPKNSFVGATGQFANNPEKWANANRINYGFLDYTPTALGGNPVPPPTRVSGLDIQAFSGVLQSRQQSLEDLKLVFGLHDAALGRMNGNASGVALQNRVEQSSRSTYQYFDNLLVALRCVGRQLVELFPHFYDTERTIRIVKPTDEDQLVAINSMENDLRYDLTKGTYDVTITTGPAYASKRQEAFDSLSGLAQQNPAAGAVIGDLIASQVDSPVAKLAALRIKATIPKEVLAATGEDDEGDMAPAELVQKLQLELSKQQMELQQKDLENQELQVKVRVAEDKSALELTKMDMEGDQTVAQLNFEEKKAKMEFDLKQRELALKERQMELAEKEFQVNAALAANKVLEKPMDTVKHPDPNADTNLGGELE